MLARKTALHFTAVTVLMALIISASVITLGGYVENSHWVDHTYQVMYRINRLAADISTAEAAQRTFIMTQDDLDLDAYWSSVADSNIMVHELIMMVSDNPSQERRLELLHPAVVERFRILDQILQIRATEKNLDTVIQAIRKGQGRQLQSKIRVLIADAMNEEQRLLTERTSWERRTFTWFICLIILGGLSAGWMLVYIRRTLVLGYQQAQLIHEATAQSRDVLEALVKYSPVAISMFDTKMTTLSVSDEWCRQFQYTREEVLGKCIYSVMDLPESWRQDHARVMNGGQRVEIKDVEFTRRDGKAECVHRTLVPWIRAGKISGVIVFHQFVTDQLNYRAELMRVRAMIDDLERAHMIIMGEMSLLPTPTPSPTLSQP